GWFTLKALFLAQAGLLTPETWHKRQKKRGKEWGEKVPGETLLRHGPGVPGRRELNLGNRRRLRQA
ncbi:TPA: hypothetical protein ACXPLK_001310, partial [Klebsiella oxytoca]